MKRSRWSLALVAWLAASLGAAPAAMPQQAATPPPLHPDTVNQVGLQWERQVIGTSSETKPLPPTRPFRFSLCEGRYLTADEVSRPCYPSPASKVTGGHNAPYVFSPGHGTPLPRGLGIDGNGILHGDDPALLSGRLPLCVRQIDVERCKEIHFGKDTLSGPDPIAKAIDNGSGPPKKGMNAGRALVVAGGLGLAAIGVGVAASALQMPVEESSSSCGTAPTLVIVSAGGQPSSGSLAAYREWCGCMGYRTATTVNGVFGCAN